MNEIFRQIWGAVSGLDASAGRGSAGESEGTVVRSGEEAPYRGVFSVMAAAAFLAGLYASSRYSYLLFHSLSELITVTVAFLIFALAWNTRRILDNSYLLFIGIASLFFGILGLAHTLAYQGLHMFPGYGAELPVQLWIAFRYLFALSFLLAPLFLTRRINAGAVFAAYLAVTALLLGLIFTDRFPACYVPGDGFTPFKSYSEYAVSLFLIAGTVLLYLHRFAFDRTVFRLLGVSLVASLLAALSYTRYVTIVDEANLAGHLFELIATYLIYRAVVVTGLVRPSSLLFRNLKLSGDALSRAKEDLENKVRERTAELAEANRELQEEIHERMRAEAKLIQLATAVDAAAEAVVITDPSTGKIRYVNPAFETITGYSAEEAAGRTLHFLESGEDSEDYFHTVREALVNEGIWSGRLVNKRKDGTLYFEECTISPVKDRKGEIINYLYIKRDVTERRRLESIAGAVNTMENIGYIFSGVRHEVGNPINSVNMILGVLRERLGSLPPAGIRSYLDQIAEQIARVEYHLRTLKSFNQFEAQVPEPLEVSVFVESFLPLVRDDLARQGIGISFSASPDTGRMSADPRALQQVLLNIVTNAADALAGRGSPSIFIRTGKKFGRILLRISDNGCGMTEDQQRNLFKPFHTSKPRGTGLGLVIVRKMLALMNGEIEVRSLLGRGTTVDIYLPEETNAPHQ